MRHIDLVVAILSVVALIIAIKAARRQRREVPWLMIRDSTFVVQNGSTRQDLTMTAFIILSGAVINLIDLHTGMSWLLLLGVAGVRVLTAIGYHEPVTMRPDGVTIRRMFLPDLHYTWSGLADRPGLLYRLGIDPQLVRPGAVVSRRDRSHRPFWWRPAIDRNAYAQILRGYLDQPWRHRLIGTGAEYDRLLVEVAGRGSAATPAFVEPEPRLIVVPESYRPRRGDALRPGDTGSRSD